MFLIQFFICIFASDELSTPQSPRPEFLVKEREYSKSPERWPEYSSHTDSIEPPLLPPIQWESVDITGPADSEMVEEISPKPNETTSSSKNLFDTLRSPTPKSIVKARNEWESAESWPKYEPFFTTIDLPSAMGINSMFSTSSQSNPPQSTKREDFEIMKVTSNQASNTPHFSIPSQRLYRQPQHKGLNFRKNTVQSVLNEADVPFEEIHILMVAGLPDSKFLANVLPLIFPNTKSKVCRDIAHDTKSIVALEFCNKNHLIETHNRINKSSLKKFEDRNKFQADLSSRRFPPPHFTRFCDVIFSPSGDIAFEIDNQFFMIVPVSVKKPRSRLAARLKKKEVCKFMKNCCPRSGVCLFLHHNLTKKVSDYCPLKKNCPGIKKGDCLLDHNYPIHDILVT